MNLDNVKRKITQKALEVFKKNYKVIKVDGSFVGFCRNNKLESLKQLDKNDISYKLGNCKQYTEYSDISVCVYGAKNPDKVHVDFTSFNLYGATGDEMMGIVRGIPDTRIVWMTKEEADAFKKEAEKHRVFLPDNEYIDTSSPEMRKVIPKDKYVIDENSTSREDAMAKTLSKLGVPVVEI